MLCASKPHSLCFEDREGVICERTMKTRDRGGGGRRDTKLLRKKHAHMGSRERRAPTCKVYIGFLFFSGNWMCAVLFLLLDCCFMWHGGTFGWSSPPSPWALSIYSAKTLAWYAAHVRSLESFGQLSAK